MTLPLASQSPLAANLICMASMMIWAAGLPAADLLIQSVPPLPLTAARMLLAAAVLMPLWWAIDGGRAVAGANWARGITVGGIGFGFGAFLLVVGQARTDAVTVAVISAAMPVIGITLECLLDGRRLHPALVAGLLLSLLGGLFAYGGRMGEIGFGLGALAAFGSVMCYTWASRQTIIGFPALSPLGRSAITLASAALVTTLAAVVQAFTGGPAPDWAVIGAEEIAALALFGIGSLALSQVLWIMSVGQLGIGVASLHSNAAPFYVMLLLFAMGGSWSWAQAFGAAIVGAGVLVAQGRPSRQTT